MTNRLEYLIREWAEDIVNNCHKSDFYGINVVEKILRDPGISSGLSKDKVLWWPRNKRIAQVSKAMHRVDKISQVCLIVRYGGLVSEDGSIFTEKHLIQNSSLTSRGVKKRLADSKRILREALDCAA